MLSNNRKVQKGKSHETKKKEKQLKTIIKNKSFFCEYYKQYEYEYLNI